MFINVFPSWGKVFLTVAAIAFLSISTDAFPSAISGIGNPNNPCAPGYSGVLSNPKTMCDWTANTHGMERASVLYGAGQKWSPGGGHAYSMGFEGAYVPFSGQWSMAVHFCPSSSVGKCTLSHAEVRLVSAISFYLSSALLIISQDPNFGGFSGTVPFSSNACYTFVDPAGNEWNSFGEFMCSDAHTLPETPAACYINFGEDLSIDMGIVERGDIATTPNRSTTIKRTIPVLCSRDGETTLQTTFRYDSFPITGGEAIQSTSTGLGVVIFYNGEVVDTSLSPSSTFTTTYTTGYSYIDLEFEAVRNPDAELKDIPTGSFSANAVMIMTQL